MFRRKERMVWILLFVLLCALFAAPSASAAGEAEYRALLIGEQRFLRYDEEYGYRLDSRDQRNVADVRNMAAMLEGVIGPDGPYGPLGETFEITREINLSYTGIRDTIRDTFRDTEDQDISILFIATHGDEEKDGDLRTAFTGDAGNADDVNTYLKHEYLSFKTLAGWLKSYVKGRVFVILESCGSGSAIYDPSVPENRGSADRDLLDARFVARAVDAFAKADTGVHFMKSTGNLRLPKFYVLTASAHEEQSYGWETHEVDTSYNFFTKWLTEGIGNREYSPADEDGDGYLSLTEMFSYVKQFDTIEDGGWMYHQHVQRYPIGNRDHLLKFPDAVSYAVTAVQRDPRTFGNERDVTVSVSRSEENDKIMDWFDAVLVDGKGVGAASYSVSPVENGGLVLVLKSKYLDRMKKGQHTVTVRFTDGAAETLLTVKKKEIPKTGDAGLPGLWIVLVVLGIAGMIAVRQHGME